MSEKNDSFTPRRANSIDGFLTGSSQRPRSPQFRHANATNVPEPQPPVVKTPVSSQGRTVGFSEMTQKQQAEPSNEHFSEPLLTPTSAARSAEPAEPAPKAPKMSRRQQRKLAKAEKKRTAGKKHRKGKRILKLFGVLVLLVVLLLGARFYKDISKLTGNKNPFSLLDIFRPVELKNDNGRVNVLVAGNSADDTGHNGGELTDSIMVLSMNTKNNTAMMLSIPRDLWVNMPGYGHAKINAAYPNGGMPLLKSVVQDNLELPIHYTALVNYTAFRDLVNAVGGIQITIQSDDPRGIYDPSLDWTSRSCCALAKYSNGPVALDGKQALNLARARGDAYGSYGYPDADYTRTKHQRQMLLAIKDKASSASVIANPLKISNLVDAVGKNATTDLQLNEMQALYYYGKKIDDTKIDSYNINNLKGEVTPMLVGDMIAGQSVQIPQAGVDDFTAISAQIKKLFTAGPLVKENAAVQVLNATDGAGLARQQANKLSAQGVNIIGKDDAAANQPQTTIIDNSQGKMPNTLAYLKKTYNATVITDNKLTYAYPAADFILVLGANAMPPTSSSGSSGSSQ